MNRKMLTLALALGLFSADVALAGDEDVLAEFAGLMPGVPLQDEELAGFYGRGATGVTAVNDQGVLTLDLSDINSNQNLTTQFTNGITTPIAFVGDNNQVSVSIVLNVQIGTVSVVDPVGSTVNASSAVNLGAVEFGIGQ